MIFDIFDFSLFVHNCIYNSPHLKERQPNIIVLQCDGLIKMVIFTIWYSSHCNILHLRDWVQKVITRHNWTTHAATEIDKKENKTERKAKEKKVDKKYCNAYQQEKKDSSTKATRKKCKTSEIGRRPKWCFIQIDLKMHKCPPDHLHKCPRVLAEARNRAFDLKISLGIHNIKRRIWKRRKRIWIFFDQFPNVDLRYIMVKCTKGEVVNVENKKIYQHFSLIYPLLLCFYGLFLRTGIESIIIVITYIYLCFCRHHHLQSHQVTVVFLSIGNQWRYVLVAFLLETTSDTFLNWNMDWWT